MSVPEVFIFIVHIRPVGGSEGFCPLAGLTANERQGEVRTRVLFWLISAGALYLSLLWSSFLQSWFSTLLFK